MKKSGSRKIREALRGIKAELLKSCEAFWSIVKGINKKKIILIASYFVYFLILLVLIFLLLPQGARQGIAEAFSPSKDAPGKAIPGSGGKYIILTFDDGWSSQYEAYKQLKRYGFKGTLYIISSLIGKEDRLTTDELKEMYDDGWDICNHTAGHADLTKISAREAFDEINGCSAWLIDHGFTRDMGYRHFAYPEGAYNSGIIEILKEQGFLTARTTNPGSDTSKLLELGRASLYGMTKENIRSFMLSDKKLIILSMHRIVSDSSAKVSTIDLKQSYFDEVISSINESGREVITITEWYGMRDGI